MYICSTDSCPSKVNSSFCCRFHSVQLLYVFGNTCHRTWLELGGQKPSASKQPYMMQFFCNLH
jgi:hypothetical protein